MASTTAEVILYFGNDDAEFVNAVNRLRFSEEPELTTQEIIKILEADRGVIP